MEASRSRVISALLASFAVLALACSDDDPDGLALARDAGVRDAGRETDGGAADPQELARRLAQLERELRDARQKLAELSTPAGDQELLAHLAQPLLAATCAHAERCCSREELELQLGEDAGAAEACESQLLSRAMRATSLSVKGVSATVFQWLSEALARQRATGFEVDADAVQACAAALAQAPCEHVDDGRCQTPDREDPCLPARLLRSVARSGDPCEPGSSLPQCAAGLACQALPGSAGRCVTAGQEGDGCAQDGDCANEALFCGPTTRRCERRRELGERCAHASEATAFDGCAPGLECDSEVCVRACEADAACDPEHDNRDCAAGLVCVVYERRCRSPGSHFECTRDSECARGSRCTRIASTDGPYCTPALAPGASCNPYVLACAPGTCVADPATQRSTCKAGCEGDEACASDEYCASHCSTFTTCPPSSVGCVPRLPDASACSTDRQCTSGHCDQAAHTCQPRRAADATCERSAQCPATQYCQGGACRPLLAAGADCTDVSADACGPGSFCRNNKGAHTCTASPKQGDPCEDWTGLECPKDSGLTCVDLRCMPERGRPLDAGCTSDASCASGYCSHLYNKCRQHLPEGAPCTASSSYDDCALGLYCGSELECTPRGTAGQRCEPRFGGRDCFSSKGPFERGKCIERASGWYCDADSLAPGSALCDGP